MKKVLIFHLVPILYGYGTYMICPPDPKTANRPMQHCGGGHPPSVEAAEQPLSLESSPSATPEMVRRRVEAVLLLVTYLLEQGLAIRVTYLLGA